MDISRINFLPDLLFLILGQPPSIFFDCNGVIDHSLMNDLIFMEIGCTFGLPNTLIIQLEQIFTAIFTRVRYSRRASIKGLPNPCACFTFIYRINKKSLAVYHELRRLTPHPWHPFNGVVTNRTSRTICQRIHHTSREYYPHDIASQIIFFGLYTSFGHQKHYLRLNNTSILFGMSSVLPAPCTIPCMQFCSPTGDQYSSSRVTFVYAQYYHI